MGYQWSFTGNVSDVATWSESLTGQGGFVYAAELVNGLTKIGQTSHAARRAKSLNAQLKALGPEPVRRIAFSHQHLSYRRTERVLHRAFSDVRVRCELFRTTIDSVAAYMTEIDFAAADTKAARDLASGKAMFNAFMEQACPGWPDATRAGLVKHDGSTSGQDRILAMLEIMKEIRRDHLDLQSRHLALEQAHEELKQRLQAHFNQAEN